MSGDTDRIAYHWGQYLVTIGPNPEFTASGGKQSFSYKRRLRVVQRLIPVFFAHRRRDSPRDGRPRRLLELCLAEAFAVRIVGDRNPIANDLPRPKRRAPPIPCVALITPGGTAAPLKDRRVVAEGR